MKNAFNIRIFVLIFCLSILVLFSCEKTKYSKVPESDFIGVWVLDGRTLFDGIQNEISETKDNYVGKVVKLNDEKLIKMFVEVGDTWVSGIKRKSNFEFTLTEKRIANQLFRLYGQNTSESFEVQFINKNSIALTKKGKDTKNSKVFYKRID